MTEDDGMTPFEPFPTSFYSSLANFILFADKTILFYKHKDLATLFDIDGLIIIFAIW